MSKKVYSVFIVCMNIFLKKVEDSKLFFLRGGEEGRGPFHKICIPKYILYNFSLEWYLNQLNTPNCLQSFELYFWNQMKHNQTYYKVYIIIDCMYMEGGGGSDSFLVARTL